MNKIEKQQNTPEEQVARELEEDIIFGRLQPGVRLREDALLERFGSTRHFIFFQSADFLFRHLAISHRLSSNS